MGSSSFKFYRSQNFSIPSSRQCFTLTYNIYIIYVRYVRHITFPFHLLINVSSLFQIFIIKSCTFYDISKLQKSRMSWIYPCINIKYTVDSRICSMYLTSCITVLSKLKTIFQRLLLSVIWNYGWLPDDISDIDIWISISMREI